MDINLYSDYLSTTVQQNTEVSKSASKDYANATDDELMDACKQFESYFLEQIFKEMEKTIVKAEDEDSTNSQLEDYFKEETIKDLAEQSTDQNSLGLAQMLYEQMKRNYDI
jgi:flagellar protein FlgJ